MSKKADLLTGQGFQESSVSKNLDLLTEPVFQGPSVSKKADLLTESDKDQLSLHRRLSEEAVINFIKWYLCFNDEKRREKKKKRK